MNNSSSFNVTPSLASAACVCDYAMNSYIYVNNLAAAVVSALVAAFTAIGNAVVIVTIIRTASLHSPANILLCSLACGDFLVAVFSYSALVAFLVYSNASDCCLFEKMEPIHKYSLLLVFSSLVQVCVMCWDRFKATSHPLLYRSVASKKKITVITVTAWVARLVNTSISGLVLPKEVMAVKLSLEVAISVIFLVTSQVLTSRAMRAHNHSVGDAIQQATAMAREKKMAVTVRWIIGASLLSGIPGIVYFVSLVVLGRDSLFCALLSPWAKIALFSNSAVNPIIYFWRHKNMRSAASELVRPCLCPVAPPE